MQAPVVRAELNLAAGCAWFAAQGAQPRAVDLAVLLVRAACIQPCHFHTSV